MDLPWETLINITKIKLLIISLLSHDKSHEKYVQIMLLYIEYFWQKATTVLEKKILAGSLAFYSFQNIKDVLL